MQEVKKYSKTAVYLTEVNISLHFVSILKERFCAIRRMSCIHHYQYTVIGKGKIMTRGSIRSFAISIAVVISGFGLSGLTFAEEEKNSLM